MISVADNSNARTVALDVRYDGRLVNPARVQFHGLLGGPDQVLSASFLNQIPGVASVGETTIGEYLPGAISGTFATLYFREGPTRGVSANGDVHHFEFGVDDPEVPKADAEAPIETLVVETGTEEFDIIWWGAWHRADGDQNGLITIADITPIGQLFNVNSDDNFAAVRSDYDRNGLVTIADLTPIGIYFGESTSEYAVSFSDTLTGPLTAGPTIAWDAAEEAEEWPGASVSPNLDTVFNKWTYHIDNTTSPSFDQLETLATDGTVFAHITPRRPASTGETDGVTSTIEITLGGGTVEDDQLFITDFDVLLEGLTGGTAGVFSPGSAASAEANTAVNFTLNSISGTFNAQAFDGPSPLPTGMETADYDAALEQAKLALNWLIDHEGAAGFRRTTDWAVFADPSPITGDPGAGVVFPDDDPESDAANAEGVLTVSLLATTGDGLPAPAGLDIKVLSTITGDITVDVTEDPDAAILEFYGSDPQTAITDLNLTLDNTVFIRVDWGTVDTLPPGPIADMGVELWRMEADPNNPGRLVGVDDGVSPIEFTYGEALDTGEFDIRLDGITNEWHAVARISGLLLEAGGQYAFRLRNGGAGAVWSSINKPTEMLGTQEPPDTNQELINVPENINGNVDYLQIFYDDPVVRRDGRINVDILTPSVDPEDPIAFVDILKPNGEEFIVELQDVQVFPQIIVEETDDEQDPDVITGPDDEDAEVGIFIVEYGQNRLVVDVAAIQGGNGQVEDPTLFYVFKLFSRQGSEYGFGDFLVPPVDIGVNDFNGIDWGVDVFDRTALEIEDRDFGGASGKRTVDKSTVGPGAATPDVIWVEFAGGYYFDWDNNPDTNNPVLYLNQTDGGEDFFTLSLRIAGITPFGSVLAIHPLHPDDFFVAGNPFSGLLRSGKTYDVGVDSPLEPGLPDTLFDKQLIVTGI